MLPQPHKPSLEIYLLYKPIFRMEDQTLLRMSLELVWSYEKRLPVVSTHRILQQFLGGLSTGQGGILQMGDYVLGENIDALLAQLFHTTQPYAKNCAHTPLLLHLIRFSFILGKEILLHRKM